MKIRLLAAALAGLLAFPAACSSADAPAGPDPLPTDVPDAAPEAAAPLAPAVFGSCPKYYASECAQIDVPLDHAAPDGETIKLHIARQPATKPAKRQLWLLSGGPGQAGDSWYQFVKLIAPALPDTDIFVVDHRGTGYSHRLTCSQQDVPTSNGGYFLDPLDAADCLEELKTNGDFARLPYFTSTQAARDVVRAIAATRAPDQKVYLWGGSYGTHWAHRVLQVAPDLAEGMIFDGFITPNQVSFVNDLDKSVEEVGLAFAAGCSADASCASHFGADALAKTRSILAGLDARPCAGAKTKSARALVSELLDSWQGRSFVFPLLHRFERCSAEDQVAIKQLVKSYQDADGYVTGLDTPRVTDAYRGSGVLGYNIIVSELWNVTGRPDPTRAQIVAAAAAQTFLQGQSSYAADLSDVHALWPIAPNDWKDLPLPVVTKTRMLWLSGTLDTRTPAAQSKKITALYDPASFVVLPGASHTPALNSPLAADPTKSCGIAIAERFVGEDRLDTSCIARMRPVIYEAQTGKSAAAWWGTADDWGDGTPKP